MTKMAVCTLASHRRSRTKSRRTEAGCTRSRAFIMQLLALAAMDPGANIQDRSENIDRVAAAIERALFAVSSGHSTLLEVFVTRMPVDVKALKQPA
jgi:hypothetical protein